MLKLSEVSTQNLLVLSLNLLLQGNASFTVTLEYKDKRPEVFTLHYIRSETLLTAKVGLSIGNFFSSALTLVYASMN